MIFENELVNFTPFMGRIIVEVMDNDDVEKYLRKLHGVSEDSKIQIAVTGHNVGAIIPITKGKIVRISENSFGDRFEKWYGKQIAEEGRKLKPGDVVKFVENQTYKLDPAGKYCIISDEHIMGYIKAEEVTNE